MAAAAAAAAMMGLEVSGSGTKGWRRGQIYWLSVFLLPSHKEHKMRRRGREALGEERGMTIY